MQCAPVSGTRAGHAVSYSPILDPRLEPHEPIDDIVGYLVRAAMNKIEDLGDREKADRRDRRRIARQGLDGVDLASDDTSPSQRALKLRISSDFAPSELCSVVR